VTKNLSQIALAELSAVAKIHKKAEVFSALPFSPGYAIL
jgi:hypothetical protein